jgi:hypothetical protein
MREDFAPGGGGWVKVLRTGKRLWIDKTRRHGGIGACGYVVKI